MKFELENFMFCHLKSRTSFLVNQELVLYHIRLNIIKLSNQSYYCRKKNKLFDKTEKSH